MLEDDVGHEDEMAHTLGQLTQLPVELLHMAMDELGGETEIVAHDGAQRTLIIAEGALRAQSHFEAGSGEQGVPEGKLLVHVEHAWDADDGTDCSGRDCGGGTVEELMVFECVDILTLDVILAFVVEHPLALVA